MSRVNPFLKLPLPTRDIEAVCLGKRSKCLAINHQLTRRHGARTGMCRRKDVGAATITSKGALDKHLPPAKAIYI